MSPFNDKSVMRTGAWCCLSGQFDARLDFRLDNVELSDNYLKHAQRLNNFIDLENKTPNQIPKVRELRRRVLRV